MPWAACSSAQEQYETAKFLCERAADQGIGVDDIFFDPGIMPIGADSEGRLARTLDTLELTHADPSMTACHASVGL